MKKFKLMKWSKPFQNWRVPKQKTWECTRSILQTINTPRSLAVFLMLKYEMHDEIVSLGIDPLHYNDPRKFSDDLLATSLLRKGDFLKLSTDPKKVARREYDDVEAKCFVVNDRLRHLISNAADRSTEHRTLANDETSRHYVHLLLKAAQKIASVLGPVPYEEILNSAGWGPGVSRTVKGGWLSASNKFRLEDGCTRDALPVIAQLNGYIPKWIIPNYSAFTGNKLTFVPKNAKTDRTIAVEPGLNLWFQKGIGASIRRRLKNVGIDLSSQTTNQDFARMGSSTGAFSTIDFSSASDSICLEVVRFLLPPDWFLVLDTFRCKFTEVDGSSFKTNKFSSMGNGFTFELESLIFYALACVCSKDPNFITVYGDDVILPSQYASTFCHLSDFCGFQVNVKKSFSSSYFRESCGGYYFDSYDCKPFFLKKKLVSFGDIHRLVNFFVRRNDEKFDKLINSFIDIVPLELRLVGPAYLGDSVMHIAPWLSRNVGWSREFQCFIVNSLVENPIERYEYDEYLLLARLYDLGDDSRSECLSGKTKHNLVSFRGKTRSRLAQVPVSAWDHTTFLYTGG